MNMQSNEQEKEQKMLQNKLKKLMIPFMLIFILVLGISFAVLNYSYQGKKKVVLTASTLNLTLDETKTLSDILVENSLPISDKEGLKQEKYSFSLVNKGPEAVDYTIYIVEDKEENQTPTSAIRYHYTRDKDNLAITRNMSETSTNNGKFILETGKIASKETYQYTFQMWLGLQAGNDAMNTKYSIHLEIEASPVDKTTYASAKPFASENLGTSCKTYDDGTDTFLVGQCSKNYVWYSGKLWRIVLKNNETGNIKMVTDNNMTTIAYNTSDNTTFENSYMDQWLNQEFLPTLHDADQYLVTNSVWDVATDSSSTPSRPNGTTTVNRTVGLLNSYEYYTTYNNSDGLATYSTGYLNNGAYWWLVTPYSASSVGYVHDNGYLYFDIPTNAIGTRPSVNLKSNIQIASGVGTEESPYRLEGDSKETINGTTLLNTRYSGEYVRFNNELYRIVGVENNLTKITAVDKPSTLSSNKFHTDDGVTNFGEASIKTDLETYYQGLDATTKNMIEPNTIWYLGTVGSGANYKVSICSAVDVNTDTKTCEKIASTTTANIGLPRVGEMFTSKITRGTRDYFWTLTPYTASKVWSVRDTGCLNGGIPADGTGVRPSVYLKSNIKIASSNTGDGTYEKPYDIELGS